jgi:hypothetical protein
MRVGVIADVHGNLVALDAVLSEMPDVDRLVKPTWGDPMVDGVPSADDMEAWRDLFEESFGPLDEE